MSSGVRFGAAEVALSRRRPLCFAGRDVTILRNSSKAGEVSARAHFRRTLLAGTALVGITLVSVAIAPDTAYALCAAGNASGGGAGGAGLAGGAGGFGQPSPASSNPINICNDGGSSATGGGGGGGGAAPTGAGGNAGGTGGTGNVAANNGGGGGVGGKHGAVITATTTNSGNVTGTTGGAGGSVTGSGGAGGGGGGGYGVVLNAAGINYTNNFAIQGGNGGFGGNAATGFGGAGGYGGSGVSINFSNVILNNNGSITAGAGGIGGAGVAGNGATNNAGSGVVIGGAGQVSGVVVNNNGSIIGGSSPGNEPSIKILNNSSATLAMGASATLTNAIVIDGALTLAQSANNATIANTIKDASTGPGQIIVNGSSGYAVTLAGSNSYSGGTTIAAETLTIGHATSGAIDVLGSGTVTFTGDGKLDASVSGTLANAISVNSGVSATIGALVGQTLTLNGTFDYNGGAGSTLHFGSAADTGTVVANMTSGNVAAGGAVSIDGGVLKIGSAFAGAAFLPENIGLPVTINAGAEVDINGFDASLNYVTSAGTGTITNTGAMATVTSSPSTTQTFAGALTGNLGLTVNGPGALTLSGANTYTGATTISGGTLLGGAANTFSAASATTVNSGGTLNLGSYAQTINNVTLNGGTITMNAYYNVNTPVFGTLAGNVTSYGGMFSAALVGSSTFQNVSGTTYIYENSLLASAGVGNLNSYTGATTISGGTIKGMGDYVLGISSAYTVAAGATLDLGGYYQMVASLAGAGTVTSTGNGAPYPVYLYLYSPATTTFSGQIKDGASPVGLNLDSSGLALTLSGTNNTFSGGVILGYGSTLTLTNANAAGTGLLTMNVGSTLSFTDTGYTLANNILFEGRGDPTIDSGSGVITLSGIISEQNAPGALTKTGTGELILTGTNTYSGGTYLQTGTLGVGNNSALGTGGLTMYDGTTLQFMASGLNIANAINFAGTAPLPVGPTIDTGAFTDTLSGVISGPGALVKIGSGKLILTNANTFTGGTEVAAGTLAGTGSIAASAVQVDSGATLGGSGTVGSFTALTGATIAPGVLTPYSILTSAGAVAFNAGSTYLVNINTSGQNDKIVSAGAATINGGTVQVQAASGTYTPTMKYTLLTAQGGVTGTFASLSTSLNLAFLTPTLSYDAKDIYLGFAVTPAPTPTPTPTPTPVTFASVAQTPNQFATASALQAQAAGSPLYNAIIGQTAPGARAAFDALSGEIHASAVSAAFEDSRLPREAVLDRLSSPYGALPSSAGGFVASAAPIVDKLSGNVLTTWGQAFGSSGHVNGDGNAASFNSTLGGFIFGADESFDAHYRVGVAGGYTQSSLSASARGSSGDVYSTFGGLYAGASFDALQLRGGALYAFNRYSTNRMVAFPGFAETDTSSYGGNVAQGFAEAGWRIAVAGFARPSYVEPFVGGLVESINTASFSESGGVGALNGLSRNYDYGATILGVRAQAGLTDSMPLTARGLLGWRHVFGDVTPNAVMAFSSAPGTPFSVSGAPIYRDAAMIEAGLDWRLNVQASLGLYYSGALSGQGSDNAIKGRFEARF